MKEDTGELREMTKAQIEAANRDLKPGKQWVQVPDPALPQVQHMNRAQRRAWARKQRLGK